MATTNVATEDANANDYEIPNHDYEVIDLEHRDRNKEDVVTSFNMKKCSAYEHPAVQS